jgi:hypothetical protein
MIPFFRMQESVERAKTNPEAYAQTMRDIESALAADPDGPGKDLLCQASKNVLQAFECNFKR